MTTKIFVNLPVADPKSSVEFFTELGFSFDADITSDDVGCLIVGENIYAMLVSEPFFKGVTGLDIADTAAVQEVALAVTVESRERVEALVEGAVAAGGGAHDYVYDDEHMYSRCFRDLDGHLWNILHMSATG